MKSKKSNQKPLPNYRTFKSSTIFFGDSPEEKARKAELKKYREEHQKPWYL